MKKIGKYKKNQRVGIKIHWIGESLFSILQHIQININNNKMTSLRDYKDNDDFEDIVSAFHLNFVDTVVEDMGKS